jgi:hypothetical protein
MYITGRNSDSTNCSDETDNELPLIEGLWDQILRKGISIDRNSKDTLQELKDSVLETSGSRLDLRHSKLDNGKGDSLGTRGMRDSSPSLWQADYTQRSQ